MSVRTGRRVGLLACSMSLMGCAVSGAQPSTNVDPVITRVADARIPYPNARVEGRLSLREGCLVINGGVAFWPAGAVWDADKRQVRFGGEFQGSAPAPVDAHFAGGGGIWDAQDDLSGVLSPDNLATLMDCAKKTRSELLILAVPATTRGGEVPNTTGR